MKSSNNLLKTKLYDKRVDLTIHNFTHFIKVPDYQNPSKIPFYQKKKQKQILTDISAIFQSQKVNVIMGESGSGKTSILNALAKKLDLQSISGKVLANGIKYNIQTFGGFANYVAQNDILLETLTVRQTLRFAADLKLLQPQHTKDQKVIHLAKKLKLQKCLDTLVGGGLLLKGISGGEKKRTAIAFELITDPKVIILDEPTSGLDSFTAYIVVKYLKRLAVKKIKTVIMTIHQPNNDIFKLFDNLILISNGNLLYQGPANQAVDYFGKLGYQCPQLHNPPDYFLSLIHPESIIAPNNLQNFAIAYKERLEDNIQQKIEEGRKSQFKPRKNANSFWSMIKILFKKDLRNISRNPLILQACLVNAIVLSLFVGGVYFNSRGTFGNQKNILSSSYINFVGGLFILSALSYITSVNQISLTFPTEKLIFQKEISSRLYNVLAYFISRNLVQIPYLILAPLLQSVILYWMIGLTTTESQFFFFYFTLVLMAIAGASLGLVLGTAAKDYKMITFIQPMVIISMIGFSGFLKNRNDLPNWFGWIQYLIPFKYGFIAIARNQLSDNYLEPLALGLGKGAAIGILIVIILLYRLMSLFFLWILRNK